MNIIRIDELGSGAAVEEFEENLQKVLDDIVDPNKKPAIKREVVLKVSIKPSEDRKFGEVSIQCDAKLAPKTPYQTQFRIGRNADGTGAAEEVEDMQQKLFDDNKGAGVVPMLKKGGES